MRQPCRRPRLLNLVCWLYAGVVWTYPAELRREFGRDLRVTFRSTAEDVLNRPSLGPLLVFGFHIATDWARTTVLGPAEPVPVSLLGLGRMDSDACGSLDRSTMSVGLLLAALGVCLMVTGWYGWLNHEAQFVNRYSWTTIAIGRHGRPVRQLRPREQSWAAAADQPLLTVSDAVSPRSRRHLKQR